MNNTAFPMDFIQNFHYTKSSLQYLSVKSKSFPQGFKGNRSRSFEQISSISVMKNALIKCSNVLPKIVLWTHTFCWSFWWEWACLIMFSSTSYLCEAPYQHEKTLLCLHLHFFLFLGFFVCLLVYSCFGGFLVCLYFFCTVFEACTFF